MLTEPLMAGELQSCLDTKALSAPEAGFVRASRNMAGAKAGDIPFRTLN
jgi:hypothetical protein